MNANDRQILDAIADLSLALTKTIRDLRPAIERKYKLGTARTTIALATALQINATIAGQISTGQLSPDASEIERGIAEIISANRDILQKLTEDENG